MKLIFFFIFCLISIKSYANAASNCATYSPNTVASSTSCSYGYTGTYCDECGLRFSDPNVKIVGGQQATAYSWPSMAYILFNYKFYFTVGSTTYLSSIKSYCGGTLITRDKVLTAAHCFSKTVSVTVSGTKYTYSVTKNSFYPSYESMYTVYFGLQNKSSAYSYSTVNSPGVSKSIYSFNWHSSYSSSTNLNDIAIIKLASEVTLSCYIQIGCLPNPSISNYPTSTNINTWAAGWGTLSSGGSSPDNLYNVKLTLYASTYCSNVSPSITKNWDNQICAGAYSGGKDTCQGDSGGPLFVSDTVNGVTKYIVVGITSYGDGCGAAGYPGIYTKVSSYLTWIDNYEQQSISSLTYGSSGAIKNLIFNTKLPVIITTIVYIFLF